ncbi:MAG: T9SS type A sorting domain-containing protein [Bacteroidales bacterium]|nr:T9SS type A sorting domain-containing protein [Bacteroidales bacterium]MCF8405457.1 T9SS type A sorting domain-containing protein [Bacteroidales bacterium]
MKKIISFLSPVLLSFIFINNLIATDIYWTGNAGDDDWFTSGNWNPAQVPTFVDNVYFVNPPSGSNNVDLGDGSAECNNMVVNGTGYTFDLNNNGTFEVYGDLIFGSGNTFYNNGYLDISNNLDCYGFIENYKSPGFFIANKFTVYSGGQVDNKGNGINFAKIVTYDMDNFGVIQNEDMSQIFIINRFNNYSQYSNYNKAYLEVGDYLYNTGDILIDKHSDLVVISTFENLGDVICEDKTTFDGDNNLLIQNYGNIYIYNQSEVLNIFEIENYQLIVNESYLETNDFYQFFNSSLINEDEVNIIYTMNNDGLVENNASLYIGDVFDNTSNGHVINKGCIEVMDDISNSGVYEGSLLCHTSVYGLGSYVFKRHSGGIGNPSAFAGWHYISSPVNYFENHDMFDYWINDWDESQNTWYDFSPGGTPCVSSPPQVFQVMKGYSIKRDLDYQCEDVNPGTGDTIEFVGTMNDIASGYFSIMVSGTDFDPGDPTNLNNWNLVGNPYTSAIDANQITFPAEIDNAIYYYDDQSLSYESFVGGVGQANIPVAQGFFIHVNTSGTFEFGLDNSVKTCTGSEDWYKSEINNLLQIKVESNGYSDETYIRFMEEATLGFDKKWDAYKLLSGVEGVPQIYSESGETKYSINSLRATNSINLEYLPSGNFEHIITVTGTDDFEVLVLKDKLENTFVNLKDQPSYSFSAKTYDISNRFTLYFTEIENISLNDAITVYSNGNQIILNNPIGQTSNVVIYNLLGQKIRSFVMTETYTEIDSQTMSGFYIVQVSNANDRFSQKVYLK